MIIYLALFFFLGLIFGSFANVCIARVPKGESIILPASRCPKCNKPIKWYDNLPIISYSLLGARCRHCAQEISVQYPIVEFITGAAFLATALAFRGESLLPVYLIFTLILVIVSVIDLNCQIIPDGLSLSLLLLGLCVSPFNIMLGDGIKIRLANSFLGALAGGGMLFIIGFAGEKIMRKEAMGGGDIKLMAGIGAMLGWARVFPVLFVASILGSLFGLTLILTKRIEKSGYIPFGPFLSLSAYLHLFIPNLAGLFWVTGR